MVVLSNTAKSFAGVLSKLEIQHRKGATLNFWIHYAYEEQNNLFVSADSISWTGISILSLSHCEALVMLRMYSNLWFTTPPELNTPLLPRSNWFCGSKDITTPEAVQLITQLVQFEIKIHQLNIIDTKKRELVPQSLGLTLRWAMPRIRNDVEHSSIH